MKNCGAAVPLSAPFFASPCGRLGKVLTNIFVDVVGFKVLLKSEPCLTIVVTTLR
jgi:hypothetical protein